MKLLQSIFQQLDSTIYATGEQISLPLFLAVHEKLTDKLQSIETIQSTTVFEIDESFPIRGEDYPTVAYIRR